MILILKNTKNFILNIDDLSLILHPSEVVNISEKFTTFEIASSNDLVSNVASGNILVNDGTNDLTITEAIRYCTMHTVIDGPRDRSSKLRVHQTARALGTMIYFTGKGDSPSNPVDIGNGSEFRIHHKVGDPMEVYRYVDFNCVENQTWVHEGYILWDNAQFDTISMEILPRTVKVVAGQNTQYMDYNGVLLPAAGNGNVLLASGMDLTSPSGGLVYMPLDDTGERATAFWDANWNTTTKRFENITPNPTGKGKYNIFTKEVLFASFANSLPLLGTGFERIVSDDTDEVGQGWRFKFRLKTNEPDHEWRIAFILSMHRKDTSFGISVQSGVEI